LILSASSLLVGGCQPEPVTPSQPPQSSATAPIQIGGEDVVTLARKATNGGSKPEFLSVTLLPGRGMNMLQVTAAIPGKGEIPLLHSPTVADAASQLTGTGKDELGNTSFSFGGAFLVPYPNRIEGEVSSDGKSVITHWRGHTLALPANFPSKNPGGRVVAIHGLITKDKVENLQTQTTADGQTVTGVIHAGDFGGHWLSDTDLNMTIALTGDAVDVTITAKNIGKEPEPMSIGWHPYFQIPSGHRAQALLHIPASMMAPVNNYGDVFPTGQLKPVKGTVYDYNAAGGVALDDHFLDDSFAHFQRTNGAIDVKLIDPESNYGLQVSALSPEIKAIQAYAPKDTSFVAIEPQFNFIDPFGKEWKSMDTGMVTLRAGQSVTWKVRLGLFKP
jgi:galactose mutarotase-like enzyme